MENKGNSIKIKFLIGGVIILAAVAFLFYQATRVGAQYFLTVRELIENKVETKDRDVRISGAVIGDSIQYDPQTTTLTFVVADIPGDNKTIEAQGGLAEVLHQAVNDPNRPRLTIVYKKDKPDLLQHEAQAIMVGRFGNDGKFYADELLLKCPTKYEEAVPDQAGD